MHQPHRAPCNNKPVSARSCSVYISLISAKNVFGLTEPLPGFKEKMKGENGMHSLKKQRKIATAIITTIMILTMALGLAPTQAQDDHGGVQQFVNQGSIPLPAG